MPPRLAKLYFRKTALVAASNQILDTAAADGDRDVTAEEQTTLDAHKTELASIETRIKREVELLEAARTATPIRTSGDGDWPGEPAAGLTCHTLGNARPALLEDPNRGFRSLGEFGVAVQQHGIQGGRPDERLSILAAITGAGQAVGSDGGFLVPPTFSTAIWNGLFEASDSLLARTDQYTVTGDSLTFNANAETSRATGSRWGGIRGYWIAEAAQMTGSTPKLRQVKLEPQQMAVLCYATDKLLRNAQAVDQWLTRAATDEINFMVGDAIVNGDGAGKPLGILGADATVSVSKETGQGAATIQTENIAKMWARLHPRARKNAVWFVNNEVEEQFDYLNISIGTGGVPAYMPPGGIADAPYGRLKGRPVLPIEFCSALGTVGDIILADLSAYATGLRGMVESAVSMHLRFDYNETAFRFLFEIDGRPWLASAITPYKATSGRTLSTFVTLATRS
jgi:HK97 family phage major capsid protein